MSCTTINIVDYYQNFQCRVYAIIHVFFDASLRRAIEISELYETSITPKIMRIALMYELTAQNGLIQSKLQFFNAFLLHNVNEDNCIDEYCVGAYELAHFLIISYRFALRMLKNNKHVLYQKLFLDLVLNFIDLEFILNHNIELNAFIIPSLPKKEDIFPILEIDNDVLKVIDSENFVWNPSNDLEYIVYSSIQNSL